MRSELDKLSVGTAEADLKQRVADEIEKSSVEWCLTRVAEKYGNVDSVRVDLSNEYFEMVEGSSLYSLHNPLVKLVEAFQEQPFVQAKIGSFGIGAYESCAVTADAKLLVFTDGELLPALHLDSVQPEEREQVDFLARCASQTGGFVWDSNEGCLAQWLKFYEFDVPATVGGCKKLVEHLNFVIPAPGALGHYWGQISGVDELSVVLTTEEQDRIKTVVAGMTSGGARLLDRIYEEAGKPLINDKGKIARTIRSILAHEKVQSLASSLNQSLGWYGTQENQSITSQDLSQLMVTAVILDLNVPDAEQRRNVICGYDLYQIANADLHPDVVLTKFENHLMTSRRVSRQVAGMAAHIMLSDLAPEFLVRGIDEGMSIGSIAWINFCATVATLELKSRGTARSMDAPTVLALANMEPCSQVMRDLQAVAFIDPVLDWGLVNGLINHDALATDSRQASSLVLNRYEARLDLLSKAASALAKPLPDKQELALTHLKRALPTCDFLERNVLFERKTPAPGSLPGQRLLETLFDAISPNPRSMAELYACDELKSGRWDLKDQPGIFRQFGSYLYTLPPIKPLVVAEVAKWYDNLKKAMVTTHKLSLSTMPSDDRRAFLKGDVSFFTLRPSVGVYHTPTVSTQSSLTGAASPLKTFLAETQKAKDEVTGRYGVIMCTVDASNKLLCYEMLTLRGECRKNERLAQIVEASGVMNHAARLDFRGDLNAFVPALPVLNLPTDLLSYTEGRKQSSAVTSRGVIEKLGVVRKSARAAEYADNAYECFEDVQAIALATFIVEKHPPATLEEVEAVALKPTPLEEERQTLESLNEYVLNLVVPFRSCIADLTSGEKARISSGVFGCVMDAIGLIGTAVGVASKVVHVVSRSVSTTAKVATLARFALITTVSVFNPLDGFGAMAKTGGKLLARGGAQLGRSGLRTLTSARFQLRRMVGRAGSADLLNPNDYAQLCQGTWRPSGTPTQRLNVCVARKGSEWYATDRFGRAWGPKLDNFVFSHALRPFRTRQALPDVYTGHILRQALPQAGVKIESALATLIKSAEKLQTDLAIGLLFGSTAKGRDNMLTFLKLIKTDFNGFSFGNCLLEAVQEDRHTIVIDSAAYMAWKQMNPQQSATHRFLKVYGENLQEHFHNEQSSSSVIAADLVHQVFQAEPKTRVLALASRPVTRVSGHYQLNVASLLSLALGQVPVAPDVKLQDKPAALQGDSGLRTTASEDRSGLYDKERTVENADTYAVMVLLLDQASGEYNWRFRRNVQAMQEAVTASNGGPVTGDVLLEFDR